MRMDVRKQLLDRLNLEEKKPEKLVAVLVDHLNIVLEISPEQKKILDYKALSELCRKYGKLIFKFTFIPEGYEISTFVYNLGFWPVPCLPKNIYDGRYKDRVDNAMTEMGLAILEHTNIDSLIIVANDGDYARLISKAQDYGKSVHLVSGEKVSYFLKKIADTRNSVPFR